jgi:hypothetical protein
MHQPSSPESSARLSAEETNPLPHARSWSSLSFPKAAPVIREKDLAPVPTRRVRADGTEEIRVEDILVIVPRSGDVKEELCEADLVEEPEEPEAEIEVEHAEAVPAFRPATVSVHATQEILADDVLAVEEAVQRDERPSTMPWTVDAGPPPVEPPHDADEVAFFGGPQQAGLSGSYPRSVGRRITNFSATQVFRRRSMNVKVVAGSVGVALSLVVFAAVARLSPASSEGPVGIAMHAPKKLDRTVRGRTLAYGTASHLDSAVTVSIDSLPSTPVRGWHRRR